MDVLVLDYKEKEIKDINTETIEATIVTYEVSKEDMERISKKSNKETYERMCVGLRKDNKIDLVYDDIANNRLLQGGLIDNKYLLQHFIVKKGLDQLINYLLTTQ